MSKSNIGPEKLHQLRVIVQRHYGAIEEIRVRASHLNDGKPFSRDYVRRILRGERNNVGLLEVAAKVAKEREQRRIEVEAVVEQVACAFA